MASGHDLDERPRKLEADLESVGYIDGEPLELTAEQIAQLQNLGYDGGLGYLGGGTSSAPPQGRPWSRMAAGDPPPIDDEYAPVHEEGFHATADRPRSTFAADTDSASYSNVRRFLENGTWPPVNAVRVEELLNAFEYDLPEPTKGAPIALASEVADCPWKPENRLVRLTLSTARVERDERPQVNLVFLVDVSGSMQDIDRLPLLQHGLRLLVERLHDDDRVAIVTYSNDARVALPSTSGFEKDRILDVVDALEAHGSTNGAAGLALAYDLAGEGFLAGGANRVILATDGDFNVGTTEEDALVRLVRRRAEGGIFLTALGFGRGNLKDARLEQLADRADGTYAYIDGEAELRRLLVDNLGAALVAVAKDVKLRVELNPVEVGRWRLLGYANRRMRAREFDVDTVDGGELGAGHAVTALYEIEPARAGRHLAGALRYQRPGYVLTDAANSGELMTLEVRYKSPEGSRSTRLEHRVVDTERSAGSGSVDMRFAAAVAGFGMLLGHSRWSGDFDWSDVLRLARQGIGDDPRGERRELVHLVRRARALSGER